MAHSYLTTDALIDLSLIDRSVHDTIRTREPDWHRLTLETLSGGTIDARLARRYAVPFDVQNPPTIVVEWLVAVMDVLAWLKHGIDPAATQWALVDARYQRVLGEIKEAADARDGLFDLPLRDGGASGVERSGPQMHATDVYGCVL